MPYSGLIMDINKVSRIKALNDISVMTIFQVAFSKMMGLIGVVYTEWNQPEPWLATKRRCKNFSIETIKNDIEILSLNKNHVLAAQMYDIHEHLQTGRHELYGLLCAGDFQIMRYRSRGIGEVGVYIARSLNDLRHSKRNYGDYTTRGLLFTER